MKIASLHQRGDWSEYSFSAEVSDTARLCLLWSGTAGTTGELRRRRLEIAALGQHFFGVLGRRLAFTRLDHIHLGQRIEHITQLTTQIFKNIGQQVAIEQ